MLADARLQQIAKLPMQVLCQLPANIKEQIAELLLNHPDGRIRANATMRRDEWLLRAMGQRFEIERARPNKPMPAKGNVSHLRPGYHCRHRGPRQRAVWRALVGYGPLSTMQLLEFVYPHSYKSLRNALFVIRRAARRYAVPVDDNPRRRPRLWRLKHPPD